MALFVSDYTKQPDQIAIDLINHDNRANLTTSIVYLGVPTANANPAIERDTQMVVTARPGLNIVGSVTVYYNRVDLKDFVGSKSLAIEVGTATRLKDLIPKINDLLGINLTSADYLDVALPAYVGTFNESYDIALVASPTSWVYKGSLTFNVRSNDIDLRDVVTATTLNGLYYQAA